MAGTVSYRTLKDPSKRAQSLALNPDAYRRYEPWFSRRLTLIRRIAEIPPGGRCLDVGSGMGLHCIFLALNGFDVSAIEPDEELLAGATDNFRIMSVRCDLRPARAESIPFDDRAFDAVFCSSVLEHVENWRLALAEMARVLKPGGVLYLFTTNRLSPVQHEVRRFPFFSWLPEAVRHWYVRYCMKHRPGQISHARFPVRFFFTRRQLVRELRRLRCEPCDREALYNPAYFVGSKRPLRRILPLFMRGPIAWALQFKAELTIYAWKAR